MKTHRINCPVCRSAELTILLKIPQNSKEFRKFLEFEKYYSSIFWKSYSEGLLDGLNYTISECQKCHFIFQSEILDSEGMKLLYNNWLDNEKLLYHYKNLIDNSSDRYLLNWLKSRFPKSHEIRILDFGAGYGNFCSVAKKMNFKVFAYDLSNEKNEHISSLDVKIINDLNEYKNYFHFIHLEQVLEHLSEPLLVLKTLKDNLLFDGLLYASTPNCKTAKNLTKKGSLDKELFRQLSPHQHINAFNTRTLKLIGETAGLKAVFPINFSDISLHADIPAFYQLKMIYRYFFKTSLIFKATSNYK